jgi:hypothetical protein
VRVTASHANARNRRRNRLLAEYAAIDDCDAVIRDEVQTRRARPGRAPGLRRLAAPRGS